MSRAKTMYDELKEELNFTRDPKEYRRLKDRYDTARMFEVIELSNKTLQTPINVSHGHIRYQLDAIRLKF
jgi:hypothetical protein